MVDVSDSISGRIGSTRAPGRMRSGGERIDWAMRSLLRKTHLKFSAPSLPNHVAIYFHALYPRDFPALRSCLAYFLGQGYRTVDPLGFAQARPDERCLFVSFDDNHRGWYEALPLFSELGAKATFYVNTLPFRDTADATTLAEYRQRIDVTSDYQTLTQDELRAIHAAGHTVACHSHSHHRLSTLPRDQWEAEIPGSKRKLEELIGAPVRDFSWPYGMRRHFSDELRGYCMGIGFATIANAIPGCQRLSVCDPLNIYRTDWHFALPMEVNIENICLDAQVFARLTGRSIIGRPPDASAR